MTSRTSRRVSWRRTRLLLAFAALLALVTGSAVASSTEAGWHDDKQIASSFDAGKVPAPTLTKNCEYKVGVPILGLGNRVRIYWRLPQGYQLDDVVVKASTSGLGSVLAPLTGFSMSGSTTSNGDGTYTTDVPTNILGGLLGLGSELEIAFVVEHESGWQSDAAAVASNAGLIAGIGGNCRNLTS